MARMLMCLIALLSATLPAKADAYRTWVEWPSVITRAQAATYARLVFEESDRAGIPRPLIDTSAEHGSADAVRFYPLINVATGTGADGWGIKLNVGLIIGFSEPRLRYGARLAVCHHQLDMLHGTALVYDDGVQHRIEKCAYHKYSELDLHEYIALYRADIGPILERTGFAIESDDDVQQMLRRMYGDPPLAHWTGR